MAVNAAKLSMGFKQLRGVTSEKELPFDPVLVLSVLALLVIGLVMMTSASITAADNEFGNPFYYFQRQLIFICVGLAIAFVVWKMPLTSWEMLRPLLLLIGLLLLVAVLIPGVGQTVNGSARWIRLGSINFQISEVIKIFMIIFFAGYLKKQQENLMSSFKPAIVPLILLAIIAGLLVAEPDFGATVVVSVTTFGMLWLAGVRLNVFIVLLLLAGATLSVVAYMEPYRIDRMTVFLDPWADPYGKGFQLSQSLIAFGRGEWLGVGLGESIQKQLYLPEAHTDFVFAVIAEELGVIGALIVVSLYTVVAWRVLRIGRKAHVKEEFFSAFLCYGVGCLLIFQSYVNIGVSMGALPTKGLTLPFMSYGGSSMLMSLFAVALAMRADYELRFPSKENAEKKN